MTLAAQVPDGETVLIDTSPIVYVLEGRQLWSGTVSIDKNDSHSNDTDARQTAALMFRGPECFGVSTTSILGIERIDCTVEVDEGIDVEMAATGKVRIAILGAGRAGGSLGLAWAGTGQEVFPKEARCARHLRRYRAKQAGPSASGGPN